MKYTVTYVLSAEPFFTFDPIDAKSGFVLDYDYNTEMFAYLNSHLLPTDICGIRIFSNGDNSNVGIYYLVDDETFEKMPSFEKLPDADLPF